MDPSTRHRFRRSPRRGSPQKRSRFGIGAVGILGFTLLWLPPCPGLQAAERPNVLFISVDDLNDWVGFLDPHPQVRTPNLDRLARRGVVFSNAHCAAPHCIPSRAAVFSGKEPFRTGAFDSTTEITELQPELTLLPQYFQVNGYDTAGTGKLLPRHTTDVFDTYFSTEQRWSPFTKGAVEYTPAEFPSKGSDNPRHVVLASGNVPGVVLPLNRLPSNDAEDPKGESFDWGPLDIDDGAMGDTRIVDWAEPRLRNAAAKPFFLGVGFYRPHVPLFAPATYFEAFPPASVILPVVPQDDLADLGPAARSFTQQTGGVERHSIVVARNQWQPAVAAYLAVLSYVDGQIGRLLDALDEGPHAENTAIVLWSDHGLHLGEKRHWGKWTGWERATRVPLVIVPPRNTTTNFAGPGVCRRPVSLIDLYPTLIELCGLPQNKNLDGRSLVPYLRRPDAPATRPARTTFGRGNTAVRSERWRLIRYADGTEELYDHASDPDEWNNLANSTEFDGVRAALRACLPINGLFVDDSACDIGIADRARTETTDLPFIRGDCNTNGTLEPVADAVFFLELFFRTGSVPRCLAACDIDADGKTNVNDVLRLLNYFFLQGGQPAAPFPICGPGNAADAQLGCELFPACGA